MSADNGYILRCNDEGKYVLQMYFASADELPYVEAARPDQIFETLEDAVYHYEEIDVQAAESGYPSSEYGLLVRVGKKT